MGLTVGKAALLWLAAGQAGAGPAVDACHAFTPGADYAETTVIRTEEGGEVTLRVPRQYFEDLWDRAGGYRDTAQLFTVEIGTFEPVTRYETAQRNRRDIWNWMTFLVGDKVPLPQMAAIEADLFADPRPPVTAYALRPGEQGLTWLATPYASDTAEPSKDVFIDPADVSALTTVIACRSPLDPALKSPSCQQSFRAAGLDVGLDYRRTELPHWREFQAEVTAFLTCATSDPS